MKHIYLSSLMMALLFTPMHVFAEPFVPDMHYAVSSPHEEVPLGPYITNFKKGYSGSITIVAPRNIYFLAKLKTYPAQKPTGYLYKALELMKVQPLPDVQQQMFIEADDGQVIAVYVDERIAAAIQQQLALEQQVRWYGYHIYNFSRGPAIVIENAELAG